MKPSMKPIFLKLGSSSKQFSIEMREYVFSQLFDVIVMKTSNLSNPKIRHRVEISIFV